MGEAYERAQLLYDHGRFDKACEEIARELAEDPNSGPAHGLWARCEVHRSNFLAARDLAERALALDPDDPHLHYTLGWVLYEDEAYLCWRPGEMNPDTTRAHQRLRRAEQHFSEALRLGGPSAGYLGFVAFCQLGQGHDNWAENTARKGLELEPDHTECLRVCAAVLSRRGDVAAASAMTARALAVDPESAPIHFSHGNVLARAGKHEEAALHAAEGLRLDPVDPGSQVAMHEFLRWRYWPYRWIHWLFVPEGRVGLWFLLLWGPALPISIASKANGWPLRLQAALTAVATFPGVLVLSSAMVADWFIQFGRVGRSLLSLGQRVRAWGVVLALVGAYGLLIISIILGRWPWVYLSATIVFVGPFVGMHLLSSRKRRNQ